MKQPISPPRKWSPATDETILREEPVEFEWRNREEADQPIFRRASGLFYVAFGSYFFYQRVSDVLADNSSWPALLGALVTVAIILFGLWQIFRKSAPSPWALMDKYVFTDRQIVLLDEVGNLMDKIQVAEIEDVTQVVKLITIIRKNDPKLENMFSIIYVNDVEDVFAFVKSHYKGVSK